MSKPLPIQKTSTSFNSLRDVSGNVYEMFQVVRSPFPILRVKAIKTNKEWSQLAVECAQSVIIIT